MKKLSTVVALAFAAIAVGGLTSCNQTSSVKKIGILQVITHDALGACRQGFVDELKAEGFDETDKKNVKFDVQIPEGDSATENSMATSLVINNDLVFGIATSSAMALKQASEKQNKATLPVLFSAVTDPVGSKLVTSFTDHGHVTGTSDAGPTAKNIDLFKEFSITKIGILYNRNETNSQVQKNEAQAACDADGITLVDGGITETSDISSTLANMITVQGIKGLFVPTDNTVAADMKAIKKTLIDNKVVTVCADSSETANGGSLGFSVDYAILGKTTGAMAAKILKGEDIAKIDVSLAASFPMGVNEDFFTETGIAIPASIQKIIDGQK
jgi:putative ABC transport system substrate-binding protein